MSKSKLVFIELYIIMTCLYITLLKPFEKNDKTEIDL